MRNDFVAFILTHGRPDKVYTYKTLRENGYSGKIIIVIDNQDKTADKYFEKFGNDVVVFDKNAIAETFDEGDNFKDRRAIIYARNACFEIAERLGYKYFIELDDDYTKFCYRFDNELKPIYNNKKITLDNIFSALINFYENTSIAAIALSQGGDFIGGKDSPRYQRPMFLRKCMNSFICSTERKFKFFGRINEDVNVYTLSGSRGLLFFTTNFISLKQKSTQSNSGGMTELYLDSGTYVKSFYSVMYMPSAVSISLMRTNNARLHHRVSWNNAVPKILAQENKRSD